MDWRRIEAFLGGSGRLEDKNGYAAFLWAHKLSFWKLNPKHFLLIILRELNMTSKINSGHIQSFFFVLIILQSTFFRFRFTLYIHHKYILNKYIQRSDFQFISLEYHLKFDSGAGAFYMPWWLQKLLRNQISILKYLNV